MVTIYVNLINHGKRTLEQVPKVIREDVRKALKEQRKEVE